MTELKVLEITFNKHEWRMADFPFGDTKEATLEAMRYFAKQECIAFARWIPENAYIAEDEYYFNSLKDGSKLTFEQLYQLYQQSKTQ